MVTAAEIAAVALFESLDEVARERLCRAAADIRLQRGEYAIHEGDERALFAVLEGRLETIALVDGVERVVGGRSAGDLVGEVPIALGTTFPFSFRAAEPCRLIRLEASEYHAVAAFAPEIAVKLGALARERISGLQGIIADAPPPRALVVGQRWDPACTTLRRFLDRNQISSRWITPDASDAAEQWGGPLPPEDDWPALRVVDGKVVVRPQLRRVAELLALPTQADAAEYDALVVGAGPAGLAAAVYGASEGLKTIVIEREAPGGQAGASSRIENYLGFPSGVSGDELASRALQQARRFGAEILVTRAIHRVDTQQHHVYLDGGDVLRARAIILACGVSWRQLSIDGFDDLIGKGISYGAARSEAANTHGLDIHIVGAGNSAGQAALFFANYARTVTILCRGDRLEKSMSRYLIDQLATRSNIDMIFHAEVVAARGSTYLEALDIRDSTSGHTVRVGSGGLFVFIGADADTNWLPPEISRDQRGFILTGPELRASSSWSLDRDPYLLETSVPGIFACGDVRSSPVKRVAAAVGEGSMTIAFLHQYLKDTASVVETSAVADRAHPRRSIGVR